MFSFQGYIEFIFNFIPIKSQKIIQILLNFENKKASSVKL
jgi:hypothetical protein